MKSARVIPSSPACVSKDGKMLRLSSSISSPSLSLLPFPFLHPHYHRAFSSYHKKVAIRDSGFESKWRTLSDSEREKINDEHDVLRKQDWKQLTLDQKRDCKFPFFIFVSFPIKLFYFSIYNFIWTTSRN